MGLHRSPLHGASVEFAEHKEYALGDEIRHIDWKVYARSDKYYVKRFEQETNLQSMLLMDASASMRYRSNDAQLTKWEYSASMAASIAYLLLRQQDAVGLTVVTDTVKTYVPPRSRSSHLMHLCELLIESEPGKRAPTSLHAAARHLSEVFTRRGVIFVLSDFLDTDSRFFSVLKQLESRRQHVVLLHVMDPWELQFPFDEMTIFRSLESGKEILAEPRVMREAYLREVRRFVTELRTGALEAGMEYRLLDTSIPLEDAMTGFVVGTPQSEDAIGV